MQLQQVDGRPVEGRVVAVLTPSDVIRAVDCPWQLLRAIDEERGLAEPAAAEQDATRSRVAEHSIEHRAQVIAARAEQARAQGLRVVEIPAADKEGAQAAHDATVAALTEGADVIVGADLLGPVEGWGLRLRARPDLVVRTDEGYRVVDARYASVVKRRARMHAGIEAAALARYVDVAPVVEVALPGPVERMLDTEAVTSMAADQWQSVLDAVADTPPGERPVEWSLDGPLPCGTCDRCAPFAQAHDDLSLVYRMNSTARTTLLDAGVRTVHDLARRASVDDLDVAPRLHAQARLQVGLGPVDGTVPMPAGESEGLRPDGALAFRVTDPERVAKLPAPNALDMFFDFEGDPWFEVDGQRTPLEYLWGVIVHAQPVAQATGDPGESTSQRYDAWWAHDLRQEKAALCAFLDEVQARVDRDAGMHVYHYAPYEVQALRRLSQRHGVRERQVEQLVASGVFVDLYEVVRAAVMTSARSLSIKSLEPFYMQRREGEVLTATASVDAYEHYRNAVAAGQQDQAQEILEGIRSYNEADCVSTLLLRDWLRSCVSGSGMTSVGTPTMGPRRSRRA